jgi:hypothetical protein
VQRCSPVVVYIAWQHGFDEPRALRAVVLRQLGAMRPFTLHGTVTRLRQREVEAAVVQRQQLTHICVPWNLSETIQKLLGIYPMFRRVKPATQLDRIESERNRWVRFAPGTHDDARRGRWR